SIGSSFRGSWWRGRRFALERRENRGRAGIGSILFLAALGMPLVVLGALLPVGTGAIDPAVLAEAGKETGEFAAAGDGWREAEKPGTARVFALAEQRLAMMEDGEFPVKPVAEELKKPVGSVAVWGGYDPFLQQIFGENPPRLAVENPPVIPLFISREARERLREFLENSGKPGVRAVMETRSVESANRFMPV